MSDLPNADAVLNGLHDILETEHAALKAGRAGEAGQLLQPKMKAMTAFDALMADPQQLRGLPDVKSRVGRIVQLATENAELFSAIRNGIGNAVSHIGQFLCWRLHIGGRQDRFFQGDRWLLQKSLRRLTDYPCVPGRKSPQPRLVQDKSLLSG